MASTTLTKSPPEPPRPERERHRLGPNIVQKLLPMAPAVVLLLLFFAGPVIWSFYTAFTNQALSGAGALHPHFIGLANFRRMWSDPTFIQSIVLTVVFVVGSAVIGQNVLGMTIALLLRNRGRFVQTTVSLVVVGAWVMPEIVAAFCWYAYLNRDGSLNDWFRHVGFHQDWLYTAPMFAVILANVWRGTAFSMMVYSAALSDIPPEIEEAASIDGAGGFTSFRRITFPLLLVGVAPILVASFAYNFNNYNVIQLLTQGGPFTPDNPNAGGTDILISYTVRLAFGGGGVQFGFASAIATLLFAITGVLAAAQFRVTRRLEEVN